MSAFTSNVPEIVIQEAEETAWAVVFRQSYVCANENLTTDQKRSIIYTKTFYLHAKSYLLK